MTTVQGILGGLGYWAVGVPPSGPMDSLSFRLGNRFAEYLEGAAGLEMTYYRSYTSVSCRFHEFALPRARCGEARWKCR
jgi:urea carboxylase